MNHYLEEFCRTTEELLGSDAVRMMGRWKHHGHISTLDHSLFVAYCSYRAARALRLDETAAARGSTEGISDLPDEALPEALRPVRERLRAAAEAETEEV